MSSQAPFKSYDFQQNVVAAANVLATFTISNPGGNESIMVDWLEYILTNQGNAASGSVGFTITDGVTNLYASWITIPATAFTTARVQLGPGVGLVGGGGRVLTAAFSAAAGANTFEGISMGGYFV